MRRWDWRAKQAPLNLLHKHTERRGNNKELLAGLQLTYVHLEHSMFGANQHVLYKHSRGQICTKDVTVGSHWARSNVFSLYFYACEPQPMWKCGFHSVFYNKLATTNQGSGGPGSLFEIIVQFCGETAGRSLLYFLASRMSLTVRCRTSKRQVNVR